jgi:hypothetical protein
MSCDSLTTDAKKALKSATSVGDQVNANQVVMNELKVAGMIDGAGKLTPVGRSCRKRLKDREGPSL